MSVHNCLMMKFESFNFDGMFWLLSVMNGLVNYTRYTVHLRRTAWGHPVIDTFFPICQINRGLWCCPARVGWFCYSMSPCIRSLAVRQTAAYHTRPEGLLANIFRIDTSIHQWSYQWSTIVIDKSKSVISDQHRWSMYCIRSIVNHIGMAVDRYFRSNNKWTWTRSRKFAERMLSL